MTPRRARWLPGDQVVLREVFHGRICAARPVTIVEDRDDLVALHLPPRMRFKRPAALDGRPLRVHRRDDDWTLVDDEWFGNDMLQLIQPGAGHAVFAWWVGPERTLDGWYINLQEPLRRTAIGFDTHDQILYIVVSADRATWRWKDEDELEQAQELGTISRQAADELRREGERALALLQASEPPYEDRWERWAPDPSWSIPTLRAGWDRETTSAALSRLPSGAAASTTR